MIKGNDNLKIVRPNVGGVPVTVGVSIYVLAVHDLSDKNMEFTMDMYFRQFWTDPRLAFENRPGLRQMMLGADKMDEIWKPDTFFVNNKPSKYISGYLCHILLKI